MKTKKKNRHAFGSVCCEILFWNTRMDSLKVTRCADMQLNATTREFYQGATKKKKRGLGKITI